MGVKRGRGNNGNMQREKSKCRTTTETTGQAIERQCIVKVTADMRCPKSESHREVSDVSVVAQCGMQLLI